MMRNSVVFLALFVFANAESQVSWPSSNWDVAPNLTSVLSTSGVEGLSGVHYNPTKKQLFLVQDIGRFRVIQLNEQTGNHLQLTNRNLTGDLEGITQINDEENEFWVINENDHRIERYQYSSNFSVVNLVHSWNLLLPQAGMTELDNGGPEDICFVPDAFLQNSGFVSSVSGGSYTSQKGLGGLIFIAHQDQGRIWVYDVNPNLSDDLALVGVYNTNRQESCGLSFDRSTGLLYILHNMDNNYLEVCNLSVSVEGQNYKLNKIQEFHVTVPTNGNKNIEGVAVAPKCDDLQNPTLWLVRDITGNQSINALKQFRPFGLLGSCESAIDGFQLDYHIYPNPSTGMVYLDLELSGGAKVELYDLQGKVIFESLMESSDNAMDFTAFPRGFYFLKINNAISKLVLE